MPDMLSLVLRVQPTHDDEIPGWTGRAAQAWFLDALRQLDPALSQTVHDESGLKPFTVSSLMGTGREALIWLRRDQSYRLRITTLHPDLTRLVLNGLLPQWLSHGLTLHDQPFRVLAAVTDPAEELWAGQTTYADLFSRVGLNPFRRELPRTLHFVFGAPTAFNKTVGDSGVKMQINLPQPELVFGSLIERWKRYAGIELHPDLLTFVRECVMVVYHQIETQRVSFERASKGAVTGFVGRVGYQVANGDAFWMRQLATLGAYALYSGVGIRTGMGLGQVRGKVGERESAVNGS
ncbi:MAG: CRISPR system precrRNA processing endoribonuclease RAMP protein Cas6 [Anaerolinea sp.]|nr:CRISPR system precrRNA processing endoribonuclease RAMP protein Cas6 [Anaerolinea sp.]